MASPTRYGNKQDTPFADDPERQQRFLDFIADAHSLSHAAKLVGCHRDTIYDYRQRNPDFNARVEHAVKQRGDFWEQRLRELGDRPKPDTLATIVGLKKEGRFIEPQYQRHQVNVQVNVGQLAQYSADELRAMLQAVQEREALVEGEVRELPALEEERDASE